MGDSVQRIPRPPQLRGLLNSQIRRNITGAFIATAVTVVLVKIFYTDVHKKQYAEFYKNYDIDKEFDRMRKKGLFDSCDPDDDD